MDKLLTRRWRLRKKLQYEEADLVRDELEAMGVSVFDKGAMWHGPGFASCAAPGIRIRMPTLPELEPKRRRSRKPNSRARVHVPCQVGGLAESVRQDLGHTAPPRGCC